MNNSSSSSSSGVGGGGCSSGGGGSGSYRRSVGSDGCSSGSSDFLRQLNMCTSSDCNSEGGRGEGGDFEESQRHARAHGCGGDGGDCDGDGENSELMLSLTPSDGQHGSQQTCSSSPYLV